MEIKYPASTTRGTILHIGGPLIALLFFFFLIATYFVAPSVFEGIMNVIREIFKAIRGG